ncbi:MAG: hypothetical protein QF672_06680 [SAR202 cluster bacterium]|nr:hypothetical protein [SAR202 cluster bacterium]
MVEPIDIANQRPESPVEELDSDLRHEIDLVDRLLNIDEKIRHMEEVAAHLESTSARFSSHPTMRRLKTEVNDRLFDLRNTEQQLTRIEEQLGQHAAEPVDLTLQQTLNVVQSLRGVAETIPDDERIADVSTSVCEGLESFVTSVLPSVESEDDDGSSDGPSPADLTMALEVIEAILACPGGDRTAIYRSLRQQFLDSACYSAWKRVNRLPDMRLDLATKKEYLHGALTIWQLLPDLSENAGSPRLSRLPDEMHRAVQQVLLRHVVGTVETGDLDSLVDTALLTKELSDEYLEMIPAISLPDAQSALGIQAAEAIIRRIRVELSALGSQRELELCLSVVSILRTVSVLEDDERIAELARPISRAKWRLRFLDGLRTIRRASLPTFVGLMGIGALTAGYIGLAVLIQRLYEINLPLAP